MDYRQNGFINDAREDGSAKQKTRAIDTNVSAKKKQIGLISALAKGANIGSVHGVKTFLILVVLSVVMLTWTDPVAAQKPNPAGIVDLPPAIDSIHGIGPIDHHAWLNVNVDGMRIRIGWKDIETQDGVYNWTPIDDCLALSATSGKFIGVSVFAGISSPPWLMGADTFTDGSTTINSSTLSSPTANFVADDVGRVIVCIDIFPLGTTIISRTSSTVAILSSPATANKTGGLTFSILGRRPGVPFRVLTAPDAGALPVPWDPTVLTKWLEFIADFGARYDENPKLLYVPMGGLGQTGESRLCDVQADVDYFNASAVAAGYTGTEDLSAGMVAWEAVARQTTDAYMIAFPTTPPFITAAAPFPTTEGGSRGLDEFITWGVATYPGRFGIMNAQLNAIAQPDFTPFAPIYDNRFTQPTGVQFLCSTGNVDNVARLSNSPPWGNSPLLWAYDAINSSFTAAVNIGCKFAETYEIDVTNSAYQTMLATQGAALRLTASPTATLLNISTRSSVLTGNQVLIGGFIITGTDPKKVLIRGIGPSLNGVGVTLFDPTLELHQGSATVITNDNWKINGQTQQSQETDIEATTIPPTNELESAILATLTPGAYTAILAGQNGGTGVGLVEVYDLARAAGSKLASISTRGFVDTGYNPMIGGFIVGAGYTQVIVRAIGPSLTNFGVAEALLDPTLELHNANGVLIQSNDNWRSDQEAEILATTIAPSNELESAIVSTLASGAFTAIVRGNNDTVGIGLVEVYQVN